MSARNPTEVQMTDIAQRIEMMSDHSLDRLVQLLGPDQLEALGEAVKIERAVRAAR